MTGQAVVGRKLINAAVVVLVASHIGLAAAGSPHFESLWGSDAASAALDVLESAYTAASCPDPADYFQDSQCLDWFCGIFGVCSESYETITNADLELVCDSSSDLGKKCANDLFLLEEVAKIKGSACSDVVSLAKYTCTKNTISTTYCGLDRYLGVAEECSLTSTCCDFLFDNATDILDRCCPTSEYEGSACSQNENLRYQCTNGFFTVVSDLGTNGPNLIREFCPALFNYETKAILGYDKWEVGCESTVSSFFSGIFQLIGDEDVDSTAGAACTSCAKDLKAVEKLAESYLTTDPSCAIISQGISRGCSNDTYQADICLYYVPFLIPSDCDDTKYSCCQDQVSVLFDTYSAAFGPDLEQVLEDWYKIESYSVVCADVSAFNQKVAGITSVCNTLVDITEESVDFCPQLYDKTTGMMQNIEGLGDECATEISNFLVNLGEGDLGTVLCRTCKNDLASLVDAATAAALTDATCSILTTLAEWSCMKDSDFLFTSSKDYFCADAVLISDSSECASATSSCCQDKLDQILDEAVADFTDAQKSAVDQVIFVNSLTTLCPSAADGSLSQTCFTPQSFCPELIDSTTNLVITDDIDISDTCSSAIDSFFVNLITGSLDTTLLCDNCASDFQKVVDYVSSSTDGSCKAVEMLYDYACTTDLANSATSAVKCGEYSLITDSADCASLTDASCCQVYLKDTLSSLLTSSSDQAAMISFWYTPNYDDVCGASEITVSLDDCVLLSATPAPTTAPTTAPSAPSPAPTATPSGGSFAPSLLATLSVLICTVLMISLL